MRNLIGVLTAATLLAGCTAYSNFDPLQTSGALLTTEGAVIVKATFVSGGYTTPTPEPVLEGYRTAAVVPIHTKVSVDHLKVHFFRVEGETETALEDASGAALVKTVTAADAERGVVMGGLKIGKTYRIKASAYKSADATESISAESTLDFKLDKLNPLAELNVQLKDVSFNGVVMPVIEITPSAELIHDGQPIIVETPLPA
jgi:hypothetical protein